MTAKFLNNYPAKNAVRIISQNRKFAIVTCILSLLGIPLFLGAGMMESYLDALSRTRDTYHYSFSCYPYMLIGGFCGAVAVLLGIFCGIRAFEEEWNKTRVDMLYSLPLNGTQRFFSNYIGGFMMYTVPYIVSVLLGWIILLIMTPLITAIEPRSEDFQEIYLYYFLGSLGLFALMCMYYTISAVCASCCGTLFENIYTNILLNLLIPGTCAAVLAVITNEVSGLDFEYSWNFIGYISPVGGLIYLIYLLVEKGIDFDSSDYTSNYQTYGGSSENSGLIPAYTRWIIVIILLTAALLVLAWKLYQGRKAEHVSKPFVYIWLYYVIISAVTACILCIGAADADALFAVILFSAIVYFIMEVIRKRGFRKFWLSVVTYIVTIAIALGGYNLITATECFGRTKYIPPVGTVTSVEISFRETGLRGYDSADYHLTYKDRETISKIQEFQRNYIQNHYDFTKQLDALCTEYHYQLQYNYNAALESYENYDYKKDYIQGYYNCFDTTSFTVTYHTIAGTSIHRSYDLYADEYFDLVKVYAGTEAYAQASASLLKNRLTSDIRKYNDKTHAYEIPDNASFDVTCFQDDTSGADQKITLSHAQADITALADAYRTDIQNLSFDNLCKDQILGYIKDMPVYDSCTGTAAFLKEHGFTETKLAEPLFNNQAPETAYYNYNTLEIRIYAPENYRTCSLHYPSCVTNAWNNVIFSQPDNFAWRDIVPVHGSGTAKQYYPDLYALLNHARRNYISAEPCYLIVINGSYYLIPAEYSEEIEKIISLGMYYYSSLPLNSYSFSSRNNYQF